MVNLAIDRDVYGLEAILIRSLSYNQLFMEKFYQANTGLDSE